MWNSLYSMLTFIHCSSNIQYIDLVFESLCLFFFLYAISWYQCTIHTCIMTKNDLMNDIWTYFYLNSPEMITPFVYLLSLILKSWYDSKSTDMTKSFSSLSKVITSPPPPPLRVQRYKVTLTIALWQSAQTHVWPIKTPWLAFVWVTALDILIPFTRTLPFIG